MLEQKTHSDDSLPTCILCNDMVISLQYEQQKPCWLDGFPGITCGLELQSVSEKKYPKFNSPPLLFGRRCWHLPGADTWWVDPSGSLCSCDTTCKVLNKGLKYGCSHFPLAPSQPVISLTLSSLHYTHSHYQGALERLLRTKLYINIGGKKKPFS